MEEQAMHRHIQRRTVRLCDFTDPSKGGTAVLVKLGDRHFLATAAHVIPDGHDIRILRDTNKGGPFEDFLQRYTDTDNDVGLLEVPVSVATMLDRDFVETDQIAIRIDNKSAIATTLCGYPGQLIETTSKIHYKSHNFRFLTLVTKTIPQRNWPTEGVLRDFKEGHDLLVRFKNDGELFHENMKDLGAEPIRSEGPTDIDLAGMSGCGMWFDYTPANEIWEPQPRLVGIQTSALHKSDGWARGTLIEHWLNLVAKNYPDLPNYVQRTIVD